jgi:hypothetical protein
MTPEKVVGILDVLLLNSDTISSIPQEEIEEAIEFAKNAVRQQNYRKIDGIESSTKITADEGMFGYDDDQFFTRDDEIEFIEIPLEEKIRETFDLQPDEIVNLRCYIDGNKLEVDFDIAGDMESTSYTTIDFRKIKRPSDLQKYVPTLLEDISKQYIDCCGGAVEGATNIEASTGSRCDKVLEAFHNNEDIDEDTYIQADTEVEFSNGFTETVDTIYLVYESRYNKYPRFKGFAHTPKGGYDWDYVDVYDITNFDLDEYMDGINIIDLEKMLADHPEIFDRS